MPKQFSVNIEKIGLEKYLNDTKEEHNNQGYDVFIFLRDPELKIGPSAIGRIMNVHRNTIRRWIEIYNKEEKNNG